MGDMFLNVDERPPSDFAVSTSSGKFSPFAVYSEDLEGKYGNGVARCPLCNRSKTKFTCKTCVNNGNICYSPELAEISTSKQDKPEALYLERKVDWMNVCRERDEQKQKCANFTKNREKYCKLAEKIEATKSSIIRHKELIASISNRIKEAHYLSQKIHQHVKSGQAYWPVCRSRLENMRAQYEMKLLSVAKKKERIEVKSSELKIATKSRILELKDNIFPIDKFDATHCLLQSRMMYGSLFPPQSCSIDYSDEEDETISALIAACTSQQQGKKDYRSELGPCHSITGKEGPVLPDNGEYYSFISKSQIDISKKPSDRSLAHNIVAALHYTTQFVNLIAYNLNLRLPHRLSYSDFTNGDLHEKKFSGKLAKLNANIIHLCSSQNVDPSYLKPRQTIVNLIKIFDVDYADLGRRGPFEVPEELEKSMQDSIEKDLVIFEEECSDSEGDWDAFPSDWETVNHGAFYEEYSAEALKNHNTAIQSISPTQTSMTVSRGGMAGNLVSSVTSFFRGWGGS